MKLILAVVPNDDSIKTTSALTAEGFIVTRLSTTGGFLMVGNTTLLIGTEDNRIDRVKDILKQHCSARRQLPSCGNDNGDATVGGATMFVLNVEEYEKI